MTWGPKTRLAAVLLVALMASCNSEDAFQSPTPEPGTGGDPNVPVTPVAASIILLADPPVLKSDAIDDAQGVTITALVRDESNNVIPDLPLTFTADSGALTVLDEITNESGRVNATLTTGGDPRNRTVTVTAASGEVESSITVDVSGTALTVAGATAIESGETETYTVTLVDAGGIGIRDITINATSANGNTITPASAVTTVEGVAEFEVTGSTGGDDTLTFTGLDLSATAEVLVSSFGLEFTSPAAGTEIAFGGSQRIDVVLRENGTPLGNTQLLFSTTRGTLSALSATTTGDGAASVTLTAAGADGAGPVIVSAQGPENVTRRLALEFVSTTPADISLQVSPSTVAPAGEASITAVVRDADGNPVKDEPVRFTLNDLSGGQLLSSTGVTDSQGVARSTYRAGNASSSLNGVEITADFGDPVVASDMATITVAAPTMFMVLGTDNLVVKNNDQATYEKTYNALITDSAGNPASPNTVFRLTLRSLEYQKGQMIPGTTEWVVAYTIPDDDDFFGTPNGNPPPVFGPYFGGPAPFGCRSEDPLGTGDINLAAFGDYNNNGQIDPAAVAIVPGEVEIDENGVAAFTIRWPQSYALWVLVRLTATAAVGGTETVRNLDFILPLAAGDLSLSGEPPNRFSPFGLVADCTDPT